MLSRAIERDRLHHALLLSGPGGVGKRTFATALACATLCSVAPAVGCGQCDTCRRILLRRHSDVTRLTRGGKGAKIPIADAREAIVRTMHAPYEASHHFLIIEDGDLLTANDTSNALLKTLEEPPPGVHFVILAENPALIIDTIVSRAIHVRLSPLPDDEVRAVVLGELEQPDTVPADRLDAAIRLAQGRPGVALELLADADSLEPTQRFVAEMMLAAQTGPPRIFGGERSPLWVSFEAAWSSIADPEALDEVEDEPEVVVVKAAGRKKSTAKKKKKSGKKLSADRARKIKPYQQRTATRRMTDLWAIHLREILRGGPGLAGLPAVERSAPELTAQLERIGELRDALMGNPNVRLALEQALLDMAPSAR